MRYNILRQVGFANARPCPPAWSSFNRYERHQIGEQSGLRSMPTIAGGATLSNHRDAVMDGRGR